jgi:hypothetical protein
LATKYIIKISKNGFAAEAVVAQEKFKCEEPKVNKVTSLKPTVRRRRRVFKCGSAKFKASLNINNTKSI